MGRTYIRIGCPKCNYSYRTTIYGYVEDPLGIPLTRCPRCNQTFRNNKHKEWIQMSPIKKYFSIAPRGNILSMFLAMIPMIALVRSNIEIGSGAMFFGILAASWFVADYLVILFRINSKTCINRIISSISRTNNEAYAKLISNFNRLYDYSIPKILMLTPSNKELIENAIKNNKKKQIVIPSFENSINNY